MRKQQILNKLEHAWVAFKGVCTGLTDEQLVEPGVTGDWSVKDILAHLSAWERLFLDWYSAGVQGTASAESPVGMGKKAIDSLNQQIYDQNQSLSLDDVLAEFRASHEQIMIIIGAIPESDMFAHSHFAWTGRLTLADYITGNTCNHYAWANSQITHWINQRDIDTTTPIPSA
jgi:hypothetical protein